MSRQFRTDQKAFWAGQFGNDYIGRNQSAQLLASNIAFFSRALESATPPASCFT